MVDLRAGTACKLYPVTVPLRAGAQLDRQIIQLLSSIVSDSTVVLEGEAIERRLKFSLGKSFLVLVNSRSPKWAGGRRKSETARKRSAGAVDD